MPSIATVHLELARLAELRRPNSVGRTSSNSATAFHRMSSLHR
jgi:hypothetical protein